MDHDRNFKELLSAFFVEFLELFLPEIAAALDRGYGVVPLDKEVFTDVTLGEQHEVDLVMKARLRDTEAFFLVHVENQAKAQAEFPKRMFRYFARLTETYDLPVYPVVIFSYDAPPRPEPHEFRVSFPGRTVLRFDYAVIQLNRLPWRRFVRQPNPVAAALMAKMRMAERERPRVKLECLRLLATLRLDPARTKLIGGFIDNYLKLSARELKQYERELKSLEPKEEQTTMALISQWEQRGIDQGKRGTALAVRSRPLRHDPCGRFRPTERTFFRAVGCAGSPVTSYRYPGRLGTLAFPALKYIRERDETSC